MSTEIEDAEIGEHEAKKRAEELLVSEVGNIPRLGDVQYEEGMYVYPLVTRMPRVILDEEGKEVVDVRYLSGNRVGEIRVDARTGEVDRSRLSDIRKDIRSQELQIEEAVQKALVSASATHFANLPFPEHRYTPILDILSEVIVDGDFRMGWLKDLGLDEYEKYQEYVEMLEDVNLIRNNDGLVEPDDVLIRILTEDSGTVEEMEMDTPSKELNVAMAHFFREGSENIEAIQGILGPHLHLSGVCYRRAIEIEEMPMVGEGALRDKLDRKYSGRDAKQKKFKMSRYLVQLEQVGLLESHKQQDGYVWKGKEGIRNEMLKQSYLEPAGELIA